MQIYLKDYIALPKPIEQKNIIRKSLKAQNSDLYYENSYMKYYYFCKQYENHFNIAKTNENQCIFLWHFFKKATSFIASNSTKIESNLIISSYYFGISSRFFYKLI